VTGDEVLSALAAACPSARPADRDDAVAGVTPRFAATPASVEEASALLRAAAGFDLAVVPRGGGSKLDWGAPPRRCDLVVDTAGLDQVIEHAAGDLVVRAQAGVSLARLGEVLAAAGQQLALDPPPGPAPPRQATAGAAPGPDGGPVPAPPPARPAATVGGTLATGAAGPRRLRYGTPRDLVIGVTVVRADGTVARSGGKVVKNVAGYDLGKLYAGSYGTLGLIVEAVFRLHPRPAAALYVTNDCAGPEDACRVIAAAAASPLAPSAVEVDRPARGERVRVGVLIEGDPDGARERAALMCALLGEAAGQRPSPPAAQSSPPATQSSPPAAQSSPPAAQSSPPAAQSSPPATQSSPPATQSSPPAWWGWPAPGRYGEPDGDGGEPGGGEPGSAGEQDGGPGDAGQRSGTGAGTLVRVAFWAAGLARVLRVIDGAAQAAGLDPAVGGSAAAGVIYAGLPSGADPAAVAAFVSGLRAALARGGADARPASAPPPDSPPVLASAVVVHAPPGVRDLLDLWGPVPSLPLMRAVKDQFDPGHRMAPGRFAGGI